MLRPKKMIPKLAVAMLALTGCGDDGGGGTGGNGTGGTGGTGGGDGGNFDASLKAFCMNAAPCFGETVAGCIDYYTNETPKNYNIDSECEAGLITYFDCGAPKTCDQLIAGACDDEYYAWFEDHCTPLP
jgi:hypothetical protein